MTIGIVSLNELTMFFNCLTAEEFSGNPFSHFTTTFENFSDSCEIFFVSMSQKGAMTHESTK